MMEIVRCQLFSNNDPGTRSVRYVPLEIFKLWKYLMKHHHDFLIEEEIASIWLEQAVYDQKKANMAPHQVDRVTEVSFRYWGEDGPGHRVVRYFLTAEYQLVKKYFLSHFEPDKRETPERETPGVFLVFDQKPDWETIRSAQED